jgi:ABC-2 type transport system permease protein
MRKMFVIAAREYLAAVRTKTFIVSLVILPVMMGGSLVVQFLLVNHGAPKRLVDLIQAKLDEYNQTKIFDASHRQIKPRLVIRLEPPAKSAAEIDQQRFQLSEEAKAGKIVGFMEINPPSDKPPDQESPARKHARVILRYQSDRPTYFEFSNFIRDVVTGGVMKELAKEDHLSEERVQTLLHPVELESKGLSRKDPGTGKIKEASESGRLAAIFAPLIMMMLMFMVVMMTATPLMQSVVEEKMQRIAEVLLGSVPPFELMMGKLTGMMGVSLTIASVYLGGAVWAAAHFGFAEYVPLELLLWFLVFQMMAEFMFGSLFIAVGAACTDMKETQNLLLPIMLLVCLPIFLLGTVIQEPSSPVVRAVSFFPFATPNLMIARLAVQRDMPWWEPVVGVVIVMSATIACVYVAGRIFRVGILMQGKGARIGEMMKWVVRG